ncbi:MAG TPA: DUF1707 domain-containing protein [Streptosporangiaceae bacterium]|nr:DUF1707 domain-containing protein [Streptosporangiaceae bacterium]
MATGPWDPGSVRFLASDADRERTVDVLKTAFVYGTLTRDELTLRTGRALTARTYAELAAITAGLTPAAPRPGPQTQARAPRKRVTKKVVVLSACAVVMPLTLGAAFLSYYGGFLVMLLFTFIGAVLSSKPPARPRPPLAKSIGGKH